MLVRPRDLREKDGSTIRIESVGRLGGSGSGPPLVDGGGTRTRTGDDGFAIRCLSHLAMPPWGSLGFATLGAPARSLADPGDEKDSGVEALVKWGSQTIDEFLG